MLFNRLYGAMALSAFVVLGVCGVALAQDREAAPNTRQFDYWQPDWMVRELWGPGRMPKGMMVRMLRHQTYMQFGVPEKYQGAKSTATGAKADIEAGREIYRSQCVSCHGTDGLGGGDPGSAVSPTPALLAYMISRPIAVDEYLLWSISAGGKQFNSEMPAFEDKLAKEDIWRVIAYMRAGFPGHGTPDK